VFCRGWVHMVYDNDEAGRRGVHGWAEDGGKKHWGAVQKLKHVGLRYQVHRYSGKDPGEVWNRLGAGGIREAFA
ncbi:unnamed protein product, partial [marine sediment metagenome]